MKGSTEQMKYEIDLNGPWKLYCPVVPDGFMVHGTIRRGPLDTGALFQNEKTGVFVQGNAGVLRSLNSREAIIAMSQAGAWKRVL